MTNKSNKTAFLIGFLTICILNSCGEKSVDEELKELDNLDIKLHEPRPGEWLTDHPEKGQTLAQYKKTNPVTVNETQNCIYIQPIGTFTTQQKKVVDYTVQYVNLFFGLKTIQLPVIAEESIPKEYKRVIDGLNEQLDASYINNSILPKIMPKNGIVIMAITAKDLYPDPTWNYVFGLANYKNRTGVSSIYRYIDPDFSRTAYSLCLKSLIKTSTHEIGHMFSMRHCIHAVCLMNGVNSLTEADTKPTVLCSECLQKLHWNLHFDNPKRFRFLIAFLRKHGLEEDVIVLERQLEVIK
jgi:archaemetzincin